MPGGDLRGVVGLGQHRDQGHGAAGERGAAYELQQGRGAEDGGNDQASSSDFDQIWVKTKPPGDRRFWSMFPLTRVPFGVPIFDPQPHTGIDKYKGALN